MKNPRPIARLMTIVLVTGGMAANIGCASAGGTYSRSARVQPRTTVLRVRNNNWQDVKLYLVHASGSVPIRVGTVTAMSSAVIRLRRPMAGTGARLLITPIGSSTGHVTELVAVDSQSELRLTVHNHLALSMLIAAPGRR